MISHDFYYKFETTTTFLKSPFNLSSANSHFFSRKREMKKWKCKQYAGQPCAMHTAWWQP